MLALIRFYWHVCLFKQGPQDSPYSKSLTVMAALVLATILISQVVVSDGQPKVGLNQVIMLVIVLISGISVYTSIILALVNLTNRIIQTLTTILMTQCIVHALAFPLVFVMPQFSKEELYQGNNALISMVYVMLVLFLNVWQLMINSYIYQHALGKKFITGLMVSFGLLAFNLLLINIV